MKEDMLLTFSSYAVDASTSYFYNKVTSQGAGQTKWLDAQYLR